MKTTVIAASFFLSLAAITSTFAAIPAPSIPNFRKVDPGVYRGGRPGPSGMDELEQLGIRTIIDLENVPAEIDAEKAIADKMDIKFISYSMDYKTRPDPERIAFVLHQLADPSNQPIYLHCKHGEDRTGLVFGLYRVHTDGWSYDKAYAEMLKFSFHPILHNLDQYFKDEAATAQ